MVWREQHTPWAGHLTLFYSTPRDVCMGKAIAEVRSVLSRHVTCFGGFGYMGSKRWGRYFVHHQ